jgi:hypothetical protein
MVNHAKTALFLAHSVELTGNKFAIGSINSLVEKRMTSLMVAKAMIFIIALSYLILSLS